MEEYSHGLKLMITKAADNVLRPKKSYKNNMEWYDENKCSNSEMEKGE